MAVALIPVPRSAAILSTSSSMRGRPAGTMSISATSLSASEGVLAKSVRSRGVQCVLPPPMIAIRVDIVPPPSP